MRRNRLARGAYNLLTSRVQGMRLCRSSVGYTRCFSMPRNESDEGSHLEASCCRVLPSVSILVRRATSILSSTGQQLERLRYSAYVNALF